MEEMVTKVKIVGKVGINNCISCSFCKEGVMALSNGGTGCIQVCVKSPAAILFTEFGAYCTRDDLFKVGCEEFCSDLPLCEQIVRKNHLCTVKGCASGRKGVCHDVHVSMLGKYGCLRYKAPSDKVLEGKRILGKNW